MAGAPAYPVVTPDNDSSHLADDDVPFEPSKSRTGQGTTGVLISITSRQGDQRRWSEARQPAGETPAGATAGHLRALPSPSEFRWRLCECGQSAVGPGPRRAGCGLCQEGRFKNRGYGSLQLGVPTAPAIRAGIEGCISTAKRVFGLSRCLWKGWSHFQRYVHLSVVSYLRFLTPSRHLAGVSYRLSRSRWPLQGC